MFYLLPRFLSELLPEFFFQMFYLLPGFLLELIPEFFSMQKLQMLFEFHEMLFTNGQF